MATTAAASDAAAATAAAASGTTQHAGTAATGKAADAATGTGDAGTKAGEAAAAGTAPATGTGTAAPAAQQTGGTADAAAAASKAPDKYELTRPAGDRVDDADLAYLEKVARGAGWTNEEAQAALNEQVAVIEAQATRWLGETKADKDYGGDQLEQSQRLARQAITKIRPEGHPRREAFLRFMNRGGAGNHIEVVSFLADLGRLMAEDSPTTGRAGAPPKSAEEVLYGKG